MFKSIFTQFSRRILKDLSYSLINIVGMTLGLVVFLSVFHFVTYHLSFDRFHHDYKQVVRVYTKTISNPGIANPGLNMVPMQLGVGAAREIPEVKSYSRVTFMKTTINKDSGTIPNLMCYVADPGFFDLFNFKILYGDPTGSLLSDHNIVLTEKVAMACFGRPDVVGKLIDIQGFPDPMTVGAVIANVPANTHLKFDVMISFLGMPVRSGDEKWLYDNTTTYLRLKPGCRIGEVEKKITDLVKIKRQSTEEEPYFLQPVHEIHMKGNLYGEITINYDRENMVTLFSIGLIILFLAIFNYINMSTARAQLRAREIGIRKTTGASKTNLVGQFLLESWIFTTLAILFALIISEVLSGFTSRLLFETDVIPARPTTYWISLIAIWLATSLLAGTYPAFVLSRFRPASVQLRMSQKNRGIWGVRQVLITLQLLITSVLLVCTIHMFLQMRFINKKDLGYDHDGIVYFDQHRETNKNYPVIKQEIKKLAGISDVTGCYELPSQIRSDTEIEFLSGEPTGKEDVNYTIADYNYFSFFNIKCKQGRVFNPGFSTDLNQAVVVNESFMKLLGSQDFEQALIRIHGKEKRIIGVCRDFHFQSLKQNVNPLVIELMENPSSCYVVAVKFLDSPVPSQLTNLNTEISRYSGNLPVMHSFMTDQIRKFYVGEMRTMDKIMILTLMAVLICAFGLLGLANFYTLNKKREVIIRKTLGATPRSLYFLLNRDFVFFIMIANTLAIPISITMIHLWLRSFAYQIGLSVSVFIMVCLVTLVLAALCILYQIIKTVRLNPVEANFT
jgi:putative ABC transport system permease protein